MSLERRALALVVAPLVFAGCVNPIVGTWKGQKVTTCIGGSDITTFTITSDLQGSGHVCSCAFNFTLTSTGANTYNANVSFGPGCFAANGAYACQLLNNDQTLDCGLLGTYDRSSG